MFHIFVKRWRRRGVRRRRRRNGAHSNGTVKHLSITIRFVACLHTKTKQINAKHFWAPAITSIIIIFRFKFPTVCLSTDEQCEFSHLPSHLIVIISSLEPRAHWSDYHKNTTQQWVWRWFNILTTATTTILMRTREQQLLRVIRINEMLFWVVVDSCWTKNANV